MCGFVGLVTPPDARAAPELHIGLQVLQHRGQDAAGIATMERLGTRFFARRGMGTSTQALGEAEIAALHGPIGLGHVRYPTFGTSTVDDAQPFFYRQPGVLMAHNGNIVNYDELRQSLLARSIHLLSRCDVEPALCEFADALVRLRPAHHTIDDAMQAFAEMRRRVRGAYAAVLALMLDDQPTLAVVRDPSGIRPAVIGRRRDDGSWLAASESVALDVLGFSVEAEPAPGEVVFLRAGQAPVRREIGGGAFAPCVFEYIYFARPDSVFGGRSVYQARLALGLALAERVAAKGLRVDAVVPVPDTARPAATSLAEHLGLPLREGFIKNRYSGRTFIMPDQLTRTTALRLKLNPLPCEIRGRRVLLVDDSIVRGNTLGRVIGMARDAGAAEVHLAIHSPPVRFPCFYGIDMSTEEELFARRHGDTLDAIEASAARALGADSLTFLSVPDMDRAFGGPRCAACFDGVYPQPLSDDDRVTVAGDRRSWRNNPAG